MKVIPQAIEKVISEISKFPGFGEKSAQRLAVYILKMPRGEAVELVKSLAEMLDKVHPCNECGLFSEEEICPVCKDENRDRSVICVVEESFDAFVIENTKVFNGLYHVLGGRLSPLEGIGPESLNIKLLIERIKKYNCREIIFATNPTPEGEATVNYIHNLLKNYPIAKTRLAYGLPFGAVLGSADDFTIAKALENKIKID